MATNSLLVRKSINMAKQRYRIQVLNIFHWSLLLLLLLWDSLLGQHKSLLFPSLHGTLRPPRLTRQWSHCTGDLRQQVETT